MVLNRIWMHLPTILTACVETHSHPKIYMNTQHVHIQASISFCIKAFFFIHFETFIHHDSNSYFLWPRVEGRQLCFECYHMSPLTTAIYSEREEFFSLEANFLLLGFKRIWCSRPNRKSKKLYKTEEDQQSVLIPLKSISHMLTNIS